MNFWPNERVKCCWNMTLSINLLYLLFLANNKSDLIKISKSERVIKHQVGPRKKVFEIRKVKKSNILQVFIKL